MEAGNKDKHIASAAEALAKYQAVCGATDDHSIADLICDLGHLSEEMGTDYLAQLQRGIRNWYMEKYSCANEIVPSPSVEILIRAR